VGAVGEAAGDAYGQEQGCSECEDCDCAFHIFKFYCSLTRDRMRAGCQKNAFAEYQSVSDLVTDGSVRF
jgi:hypothetical protein